MEATNYLLNNFDAIQVYTADAEARNGGATEPHVSHVLSSRLSSRPMGWSTKTLKAFVPILAAGQCSFRAKVTDPEVPKNAKAKRHSLKPPAHTLGLPHPDWVAFIPANNGKVTPLFRLLQSYFK